ncbi:MAG: hypothetical protein Q9226_002876, partial [Calogaya cf. arnoldii]
MPNDPYLGCQRFSTIDFASYFTTGLDSERALPAVVLPDNDVDDTSHNTCLGTYDEVSRRALSCEFCQLVIKALAATTAELHRRGTLQHIAQVFLDSVRAGFYYDRATASSDNPNEVALEEKRSDSSKQVNVRCIMVSLAKTHVPWKAHRQPRFAGSPTGGSQGLQLLKSNETQLRVKGALRDAWANIPAVIRDAIELVRDLNTGGEDEPAIHLWVDQLCIIQDDPKDKATQIHQMNQVYSRAIATLIATEGSHSNVALSRHHCHTVSLAPRRQTPLSSGQMIKNIQGLRLLAALPSLSETTALSVWATRAWTMQEVELSHASIFFGRDQVIFRCAQEVFREDFVAEITGQGYRDIEITHPKWLNSQALERRAVPVEDKDWPITFEWYSTLVENYTQRAMTYPTDILPAFAGVAQIFHAVCAWKISNGLIEDVIDYSLLWRPKGIIQRRFTQNGDPNQKQQDKTNQCLPTYAWCAWLGQVVYEPRTYDIRSLIARFEVAGAGKSKRQL